MHKQYFGSTLAVLWQYFKGTGTTCTNTGGIWASASASLASGFHSLFLAPAFSPSSLLPIPSLPPIPFSSLRKCLQDDGEEVGEEAEEGSSGAAATASTGGAKKKKNKKKK